ncbi:hypothetical protein [Nocardiopsis sp. CNR-923]|uniref:hypothetical protein n=1 Tax=Nocardiopsis sp. CNR-923 TaxID=1904965 RepID=UPI0021CCF04E|nr:hypothetical protein [Nocardiopsis sp. CNR-923]
MLPIALTRWEVSRWEGGLLLGFYIAYIAYLVMEATGHAALRPFGAAMVWFVIPLTVLVVSSVTVYELTTRRAATRTASDPKESAP